MTTDDVKLGMFLSMPFQIEPIILFIASDDIEREAYEIVDLNKERTSYLSYYAVTKDVEEFEGDIDEAKQKTIEAVFS